jgi:hypothetical protein
MPIRFITLKLLNGQHKNRTENMLCEAILVDCSSYMWQNALASWHGALFLNSFAHLNGDYVVLP